MYILVTGQDVLFYDLITIAILLVVMLQILYLVSYIILVYGSLFLVMYKQTDQQMFLGAEEGCAVQVHGLSDP